MAIDPWMQDAATGTPSYTAQEIRLATVTPFTAGAGVSLGVRSGVRNSGSDTDLLVSAQAAPNMTVKVSPGVCVVQSATAGQGAYTWALTATETLNIGAAHASLARTDLIAVRVRDDNVDGSGAQDGDVVVVPGTPGSSAPALPSGASYMEIARVAVAAGAASINAAAITDRRPFYASPGGIVAATAATEPAAGAVAPHQYVYRTDLNGGVLRRTDGGAWRMAAPYRARTVLAAPAAQVTFSGLSGLDNIVIRTHACSDYAADYFPLYLRIDANATGTYAGQYVEVLDTTSTPYSYIGQNVARVGSLTGNSGGPAHGSYGTSVIELHGFNATAYALFTFQSYARPLTGSTVYEHGGGQFGVGAAHDSITLLPFYANFAAGSRFSIEAWD